MSLELKRTYHFTDTIGNSTGDAFVDDDPDAEVAIDLGSHPFDVRHQKFDISGRPIVPHMLRHIVELHRELDRATYLTRVAKEQVGITGVVINSAPRTQKGSPDPFYLATLFGGRIRVVAPIDQLSAIKNEVEELDMLSPNNPLYDTREQFRSRKVGFLLNPNHGIHLERGNPEDIHDPPQEWAIAYVDKFGNIITYDPRREYGGTFSQNVVTIRTGFQERGLRVVESLDEAAPGEEILYQNGRNVDMTRKWRPGERWTDPESRRKIQRASLYDFFRKPSVGQVISRVK